MLQRSSQSGLNVVSVVALFLFAGLFCIAPSLHAQSTLVFPRLAFDETITGLAIVNPGAAEAVVTLTAFGRNGEILQGKNFNNPVEVRIPAGQQFANTVSAIFGPGLDEEEIGWAAGISEQDDLTGFFLILNPSFSLFDGADLPLFAAEVIFNEISVGVGGETEVNLINPNPVVTEVQLDLHVASREPSKTKRLNLPAGGVARLDLRDFFTLENIDPNAYLRASAVRPIGGFLFVRGPEGDLLGSNARPSAEQLDRLYFPQLAVLGPFETELAVTNYGDQAVLLTITAHRPNGQPFGPERIEENPVTRALLPGQSMRENLEEMFGFRGAGPVDGWLEVVSSQKAINGSLRYRLAGTGALASVSSQVQGRKEALFSHIATSLGFFTGLAILNPGSLAADLRIVAMDPSGVILGVYNGILAPGQRISQLVGVPGELIPEAADQAGGFLWVSSNLPVFMTSLFGRPDTGVLANIPPQPVPNTFEPDEGITRTEVTPRLVVLAPSAVQRFTAEGASGPVDWRLVEVEGVDQGRISDRGRYVAPAQVPDSLPVTILAESGGQTAGASADVLDKRDLLLGRSVIQSVAYLQGLDRLFTSELESLGTAARTSSSSPAQGGEDSVIYDVSSGAALELRRFEAEEIPKIIPYKQGGREFLLLVLKNAGKLVRLDPESESVRDVAVGLDAPTAVAVDSGSGDLLVAERNQVRVIPADDLLTAGLGPAENSSGSRGRAQVLPDGVIYEGSPSGVSFDECTGDVYVSDRETGTINQLQCNFFSCDQEALSTGLAGPGQQLTVSRKGVACPQATHLFVVEEESGEISLVLPDSRQRLDWLSGVGTTDVAFLSAATTAGFALASIGGGAIPADSHSELGVSILTAENDEGGGAVRAAPVEDLYQDQPINQPTPPVFGDTRLSLDAVQETEAMGESSFRTFMEISIAHGEESTSDAAYVDLEALLQEEIEPLIIVPSTLTSEGFDLSQCEYLPTRGPEISEEGIVMVYWDDGFPLSASCTIFYAVDHLMQAGHLVSLRWRNTRLQPGH